MKFESKKDTMHPFLISMIVLLIPTYMTSTTVVRDTLIVSGIMTLIIFVWLGTNYTFTNDNKLRLDFVLYRGTIDIDKIEYVKSANNFSSKIFTLSSDTLLIKSNQGFWNSGWYVCPLNREKFIEELKKRNPNIDFKI